MSGYVPSMVLLGGLYLEHQKEKLGKRFDADEAWAEFMQFVKNKRADAWDDCLELLESNSEIDLDDLEHYKQICPYRKQEEA